MAEQRARYRIQEHTIATIRQELEHAGMADNIKLVLADDKCACWFERVRRFGSPVQLSAVFTHGNSALSWWRGYQTAKQDAAEEQNAKLAEQQKGLITITKPSALWHAFGGPQRRIIDIPENPAFDLGKLITGLRALNNQLLVEFWPVEATNGDKDTAENR